MGWGHCGTDSKGREIGYSIEAKCDFLGCNEDIDRGLSYACGGMHGVYDRHGREEGCEGYFCPKHLSSAWPEGEDKPSDQYCLTCTAEIDAREPEEEAA